MPSEAKQKQADALRRWRESQPKKETVQSEWAKANRKRYIRNYMKKRRDTDPTFRLLRNLRSRMHHVVRGRKSASTLGLVGCSADELRAFIESKFSDGMTWEAVMDGRIHIDHIKPCASFDLSDADQQKQCFHFTNLQPLWWTDNLRKGARHAD